MGACYGRLLSTNGRHGSNNGEGRTNNNQNSTSQQRRREFVGRGVRLKGPSSNVTWMSETPITMGQLNSKRDEFWETAPVFEGRKEVWEALKAAAAILEKERDVPLAQAILDGANIILPNGSLMEAYDELGTQYKVPLFCLSTPTNILVEEGDFEEAEEGDPPARGSGGGSGAGGGGGTKEEENQQTLKLRLSLSGGRDVDLRAGLSERVGQAKAKLAFKLNLHSRQRWLYGGKLLEDKTKVRNLGIPDGHIIQVAFIDPQKPEKTTKVSEQAETSSISASSLFME